MNTLPVELLDVILAHHPPEGRLRAAIGMGRVCLDAARHLSLQSQIHCFWHFGIYVSSAWKGHDARISTTCCRCRKLIDGVVVEHSHVTHLCIDFIIYKMRDGSSYIWEEDSPLVACERCGPAALSGLEEDWPWAISCL